MANRIQPSIQPYPPRPIPRTVKQAIADAKKPTPPARDPIVEENRSRPEATLIIRAAERGRVTPNEVADIAEVVEQGINPEGYNTMATPELHGDQFYISASAAERLTTFVEKYGTTVETARLDASVMKALAKRGPYADAEITPAEARALVAAAQKSGGVKLDEVHRIMELLYKGVDPETMHTMAVPELANDAFYLHRGAREILEVFVDQHGVRRFPGPNVVEIPANGMDDDRDGFVDEDVQAAEGFGDRD